jgi:hypothetical protein
VGAVKIAYADMGYTGHQVPVSVWLLHALEITWVLLAKHSLLQPQTHLLLFHGLRGQPMRILKQSPALQKLFVTGSIIIIYIWIVIFSGAFAHLFVAPYTRHFGEDKPAPATAASTASVHSFVQTPMSR